MDSQILVRQLEQEGFKNVMVTEHAPNTIFGEHTHESTTIHIILTGELTLIDKTGTRTLRAGDRFEISAGTTHTAQCGPEGCSFIVGIK